MCHSQNTRTGEEYYAFSSALVIEQYNFVRKVTRVEIEPDWRCETLVETFHSILWRVIAMFENDESIAMYTPIEQLGWCISDSFGDVDPIPSNTVFVDGAEYLAKSYAHYLGRDMTISCIRRRDHVDAVLISFETHIYDAEQSALIQTPLLTAMCYIAIEIVSRHGFYLKPNDNVLESMPSLRYKVFDIANDNEDCVCTRTFLPLSPNKDHFSLNDLHHSVVKTFSKHAKSLLYE